MQIYDNYHFLIFLVVIIETIGKVIANSFLICERGTQHFIRHNLREEYS